MAGGALAAVPKDQIAKYNGKITWYVWFCSIAGGFGGLLFGYDVGITGGVTSFQNFLERFFPAVANKTENHSGDKWCTYNDAGLQMFTSSLFLAACIAGLVASPITRRCGRKTTMLTAGICFIVGAVLTASAYQLPQLVVGRIVLGAGVGLATQAVPLYLSEIAPVHIRGQLNIMFQLSITIGILIAQIINYGVERLPGDQGWRTSLGLAGLPAVILTLAAILLPETPNSLAERGRVQEARRILEKIRGTEDVTAEMNDIIAAAEEAKEIKYPWYNLFCTRDYTPEAVVATLVPCFQQWTGINSVMFYAPIIFKTINPQSGALLATMITGVINVAATFISIALVEKAGRKMLFLVGGAQMIVAEVVVAALLGHYFTAAADWVVPNDVGLAILIIICIFVSGFAYSWGPLGWLYPSEVLSLETRSAGYGIVTAMNFLMTFVVGQSFLSMMCAMKFGIFLFFAGMVCLMSVFVAAVLPETQGIPLEEMGLIWSNYWLWKGWAKALYERHPERRPDFRMRPDLEDPKAQKGVHTSVHPAAKPVGGL